MIPPPEMALDQLERILGGVRAAPQARARTVLVIDDNADYRQAVAHLLKGSVARILEAEDGARGVELAASARPDLILLDYNLPRLNGYEVLQELQRNMETRRIPVIMLTGAPNREHIKELDLGVKAFLYKPVPNLLLLEKVGAALSISIRSAPEPQAPAETAASSAPEASAPAAPPASVEPAAPVEPSPPTVPIKISLPEPSEEPDDALLQVIDAAAEDKPRAEEKGIELAVQDSSLVSQVNRILIRAVELGASDIHIEPQEDKLVVRVRVNGSLQPLCAMPAAINARFSARVKIMANLVITERRLPQDGQFRVMIRGQKIEFRVSSLPCTYGEKIVIRVLGQGKLKSDLNGLTMSARDLECVKRALRSPHGLILVTGPTGSGKTTSLYTMLGALNKPDVNILTAEDPVEYRLPGISQVQVMPSIGLNFEAALRSFLRQDPDVMLVGEIRDRETAEIAVKASITGHLVLSTLHTNSAPATITRLTHMGLPPFLAAASVKLVVAQRLIKTLCPKCRRPAKLEDEDRRCLSDAEAARLRETARAEGCPACRHTGYGGRRAIFEVMPVATMRMRQTILSSQDPDELARLAVEEGMTSLRAAAIDAAASGETSVDEAFKIVFAD